MWQEGAFDLMACLATKVPNGRISSANAIVILSNDPMLWPLINSYRLLSYFLVASFAAVIYDWALTFGQEFELIWRQPWSHMTILYLSVRYAGLPYAVAVVLSSIPSVSVSDAG